MVSLLQKSFIAEYKEKLSVFNRQLRKLILEFFKKTPKGSISEIIDFIRSRYKEFDLVFRESYKTAYHYFRKTLIN